MPNILLIAPSRPVRLIARAPALGPELPVGITNTKMWGESMYGAIEEWGGSKIVIPYLLVAKPRQPYLLAPASPVGE